MKFSLVIPCYNEADNIPLLLERCKGIIQNPDIEVILVDNGSIDNTPEVLQTMLPQFTGCRSVRVEINKGYGFGILAGLRHATGEILGWTHADMQTDPQDALTGLELFDRFGNDILVKGKRYGRPVVDNVFTIGMSVFETILLGKPMWDINAQPTMFSKVFFESWDEAPSDFSLDLYAYYYARLKRLDVHRFPVKFGERAHGTSHWNVDWASKRKFIKRTAEFSVQLRKTLK